MLQIISIYKVTDFAPLFVTVTTAEQCFLDLYPRQVIMGMVSAHLSDMRIITNNSPVRIRQFQFSMALADEEIHIITCASLLLTELFTASKTTSPLVFVWV